MNEPLNVKGKPYRYWPLIILGNLFTVWQCDTCREKKPHVPWSGRRMGEDRIHKGRCSHCVSSQKMKARYERAIADLQK